MNCMQYEELCRHFLSQMLGLPIEKITSERIANPKRGDLAQYSHQIDLHWETEDGISRYVNIANAKWRGSSKVDQPDVLLLQQVKQELSAHKAVMITNSGFTLGAKTAAQDKGIALYIVEPVFDISILEGMDRDSIRAKIQALAASRSQPLFQHTLIHKAFELQQGTAPSPTPQHTTPLSYNIKKSLQVPLIKHLLAILERKGKMSVQREVSVVCLGVRVSEQAGSIPSERIP